MRSLRGSPPAAWSSAGEGGGELAGAAEQPGQVDRDRVLRAARDAFAVSGFGAPVDEIVLLKSLFNTMRDVPAGELDPAMRGRLFAVIADGLRRSH